MMARFLKAEGYDHVDALSTPDAAVQYIEAQKPDFVFLDINLNAPMTGMDILKRVRETTPETLVCMASAYRDEHERSSLALGAMWFLKKPTTVDDLLAVVRSIER